MSNEQDIDPLDLSEQEAAEARRGDAMRLQRLTEVDDLKWLMSDKRGRRIMAWLLNKTGMLAIDFQPDALLTAFKEGRRSLGVEVTRDLVEHTLDEYNRMTKEYQAWAKKLQVR